MTSYYNQIPTLAMRARAAELIVVGRVVRALGTDVELHEGKTYQRTTYEVQVERVLKPGKEGQLGAARPGDGKATLAVQVLDGEVPADGRPREWVGADGAELLLMLSVGMQAGTYVPYLGSAFPVGPEGYLQLGEHAAEKIGLLGAARSDARGIELQAVAALVDEVMREEAEEVDRASGEDGATTPAPVSEMPVDHQGGGRHAAPL